MQHIGWVLLLVALATDVRGEYQFNILVDDMVENVECFDPASCVPVEGYAQVTNLATQWAYTVPIASSGPGGLPLAYQFVLLADGIVPFGFNHLDYIEVSWSGPGFRYLYTWYCPDMFSCVLPTDPPANPPVTMEILPGTGCYSPVYPLDWTWANFSGGAVMLDDVFTVEPGETLRVAPGMRIESGIWGGLRVLGTLLVEGTEDSSVVFLGPNWRGLRFQENGGGRLVHTRVSGVDTETDGGALYLESGCDVELDHCILHHNSALERGGGAFLAGGALLRMRSCTVSHNSATTGGNLYVEAGGFVTGYYNLVTFGEPESMASETGPLAGNLQYSAVYPLQNPSEGTGWYCDPGYADPANGDFSLSYWNPADPDERNCVIDAATIEEDLDPDGTPMDMGAIPFDQSGVLLPARILELSDRPGDEGGMMTLSFAASPNDGTALNPVSMYSIWMRYHGSDGIVPAGMAVGALGLPGYSLLLPTLWDSTASNGDTPDEFTCTVYVCTHSATHPLLHTFSAPRAGYSIDNLAPPAVAGFGHSGTWIENINEGTMSLDLRWDYCPAGDFDHFELFYEDPDIQQTISLGLLHDTRYRHTVPYLQYLGDVFVYTIVARDHAGNESPVSTCIGPVDPFIAVVREPSPGFALQQNHPNPFNPSTTLHYELARMVDVGLRVYNMQGRMVREQIQGRQPAGHYEWVFDAGNLASGVYFCQLRAGEYTQIRKMVLLR